jgi:uncharacterized protein
MKTDVRFPSADVMLAAHLYTPDNPSWERSPAIVVGHHTTGGEGAVGGQGDR